MKTRSLLMLIMLYGGLALWSAWPDPVVAQQAGDRDHHAGHEHGEGEAGDRAGRDHEDAHGDGDHTDHGGSHTGHDGHPGHDDEASGVHISPEVMQEFGIEVETAGGGSISRLVRLPGEVVYNDDRIAHVSPTVAGIVQKVNFSVGDRVEKGQVMAVLNSREVAAARSAYLAARARLALTEAILKRDRRLYEEKVGTERAALESQQAFEEAEIAVNQAENALHALGYAHDQIYQVESLGDTEFNTYELLAPISGIVTQRHLTIGEVIEPAGNGAPFVVADLATVWVNLTVYQRDLAHVKANQPVEIRFGHGIPDTNGKVEFVSPALDEATRTAFARIVVVNPDGHWRPGLFVEGVVQTGHDTAAVVVPRSAVIGMDQGQVIFVKTAKGFEPRPVRLGRTTETHAEIVSGLSPGERYAARNVLALKAEMNRAALEHAGHAH